MKARAIVVIDYIIEGGFKDAADEQTRLEKAIADIVKDNKAVVHHAVDMRERRGDAKPDLSTMKFRSY